MRKELRTHCPILSHCVEAAATVRPNKAAGPGARREEVVDYGVVGLFGGIIGATHKNTMRLMQKIIGLQLWLGGCKREVGDLF